MSIKSLISHDMSARDPREPVTYAPSVGPPVRRIDYTTHLMEDPTARKKEMQVASESRVAEQHHRRKANTVEGDGPTFFEGNRSSPHRRVGLGLEKRWDVPTEAIEQHQRETAKHEQMRRENMGLVEHTKKMKEEEHIHSVIEDRQLWGAEEPWGRPAVGAARRSPSGRLLAAKPSTVTTGRYMTDGPDDAYVALHFGKSSPEHADARRREGLAHNKHLTSGPPDSYVAQNFGRPGVGVPARSPSGKMLRPPRQREAQFGSVGEALVASSPSPSRSPPL